MIVYPESRSFLQHILPPELINVEKWGQLKEFKDKILS